MNSSVMMSAVVSLVCDHSNCNFWPDNTSCMTQRPWKKTVLFKCHHKLLLCLSQGSSSSQPHVISKGHSSALSVEEEKNVISNVYVHKFEVQQCIQIMNSMLSTEKIITLKRDTVLYLKYLQFQFSHYVGNETLPTIITF